MLIFAGVQVYDRNSFGSCSIGRLRQSLVIFVNLQKMLGNIWKRFGKGLEMFGKFFGKSS